MVSSLRVPRGIDWMTAITIIAKIGDLRRFDNAPRVVSYLGLVPTEHRSGGRRHTSTITKVGNGVERLVLIESAWTYPFGPRETRHLRFEAAVTAVAWELARYV